MRIDLAIADKAQRLGPGRRLEFYLRSGARGPSTPDVDNHAVRLAILVLKMKGNTVDAIRDRYLFERRRVGDRGVNRRGQQPSEQNRRCSNDPENINKFHGGALDQE